MEDRYIEKYKAIRSAIKDGHVGDVAALIGDDQELLQLETPFGSWLHMAASDGQLEIAEWCLDAGIDVNRLGGIGDVRPLNKAASEGQVQVAQLLIDRGAVLDTSTSLLNPLFSAIVGEISPSQTAVACLLIESGIDVTVRYPNVLVYRPYAGRGAGCGDVSVARM